LEVGLQKCTKTEFQHRNLSKDQFGHKFPKMVTACLCLNYRQGAKLVAVASIFCGIATTATSSWILHRSLQMRKNPTLFTANDLLHQVNTFFGGTTGLYDLDVIFRILISCSATALAGGFVQFVMSFWLMLASIKGGHAMAKIWLGVHILILIGIGGGFLCILTNELEINTPIYIFLIITGADFLLLIYFCLVVASFSNESSQRMLRGGGNDDEPYFIPGVGYVEKNGRPPGTAVPINVGGGASSDV